MIGSNEIIWPLLKRANAKIANYYKVTFSIKQNNGQIKRELNIVLLFIALNILATFSIQELESTFQLFGKSSERAKFSLNFCRVYQKNCVLLVWLLRRTCRLDNLDFTQLHRPGFNFEFETLLESSDTWLLIYGQEKTKLLVASKQHFCCSPAMSNEVIFQRKDSIIVQKFLLNLLKG